MAARRYEISLRVLKNISRVSANIFNTKGAIYYVAIATVIFSHVKITIMLFSRVKISCSRAKAHLVFHWCLYNNKKYS